MNNYWGEPDDEPLPDWMDPIKCKQVNERRSTARPLTDIIQECLNQPSIPVEIIPPRDE